MTQPLRAGAATTSALRRWDGLLLDPRAHPSAGPGRVRGHTAFQTKSLLLHASDPAVRARAEAAVRQAAGGVTCEFVGSRVLLTAAEGAAPVDPWAITSAVARSGDAEVAEAVGLDHLLSMAEQVGGNPFAIGHGRPGLDRYGLPDYPGRGPVAWPGLRPQPRAAGRRPRVVVLDTGIGRHPWFTTDPAVTTITVGGRTIGPEIDPGSIKAPGADGGGVIGAVMLGALGTHAGHGTFIAGLLRQACPEAEIVALAVMGSDGVVPESTLSDALLSVVQKQREEPGWADALVLSLGYYSEDADDLQYTSGLRTVLLDLVTEGVAVFCAAGNDASTRPSYPAAFAVDPAFHAPGLAPLVSVAALNPGGSLATFSNRGPWVTRGALGVNLVSTAPVIADGSDAPRMRAAGFRGRSRATLDPDDLRSGFASWSGTSFAAPLLAGQYLAALAADGSPGDPERRRALLPGVALASPGAT